MSERASGTGIYWVAVKEFNLNYHNVDTWQRLWFLHYGSLNSLTATQ